MWKQANNSATPFTVLELRFTGDEAVMKNSLDTPVEINAAGKLQLQNFAAAPPFASMRDDTPYNLRNSR
jgi:hypothetical protein